MLNKIQQKGAVAIILAVLLLSVLSVIGLGIAVLMTNQIVMSGQVGNSVVAYYAAEAGSEECLYELRHGSGSCPASGLLDNGADYDVSYNGVDTIQSIGHFEGADRKIEITW